MTTDQALITGILIVTFVLFMWGRFRHDVVAFTALVLAALTGVVPAPTMFSGFGHPATITVAMVLILSRGLQNAGAVDIVARYLLPPLERPEAHIGAISSVAASLSAVMNNVGALALLMPASIASAARANRRAAQILMPLSFASILGGLVTLIGTPPNIIVAAIRGEVQGTPFGMFDFTPVGGAIAVGGIAFISLIGWRLIPEARRVGPTVAESVAIENYVSEARVARGSKAIGKRLSELDTIAEEFDAVILEVLRNGRRLSLSRRAVELKTSDVLVIKAGPDAIERVRRALDVTPPSARRKRPVVLGGEDIALMEAVVQPHSDLAGSTFADTGMRRRFGVNLVAVSHAGRPTRLRLKDFRFQVGDVLLLEGDSERLGDAAAYYGCLPLASRPMTVGKLHLAGQATALLGAAVILAALGVVALPLAFALAAAGMVVMNLVPLRDLYDSVDWPVVVLIGALIPVGQALESTGATALAAGAILDLAAGAGPVLLLVLVMVVTMTLSDLINNAATAVVMAPLGVGIAEAMAVNSDAFLMAVAVGASCAFLTPIGHQNNALIMGPGGYHFGDYWRMGLPVEIIVLLIGVPMLLIVWPL